MISLLLDQGLPRRAAADLRVQGWTVVHVGELGMATATDEQILTHARTAGMTVVTLDRDFARLLAVSGASTPSLIHVRIERVTRTHLVEILRDLVPRVVEDLLAGAIVSVGTDDARVRRLPVSVL